MCCSRKSAPDKIWNPDIIEKTKYKAINSFYAILGWF